MHVVSSWTMSSPRQSSAHWVHDSAQSEQASIQATSSSRSTLALARVGVEHLVGNFGDRHSAPPWLLVLWALHPERGLELSTVLRIEIVDVGL